MPIDAVTRYRIRTPQVACQTLEGESVLLSFESGCYYSTEGIGSVIIRLLEQRVTVVEIVGHVARIGAAEPGEVGATVGAFLAELEREGLVALDSGAAPTAWTPPPWPDADVTWPPTLQKFSDLQELLLLDPIHDSGEAGWPWSPGTRSPGGL
jgi:hypothetical protein